MEDLKKELESTEYSINEIEEIIDDLKQWKVDFEYTMDYLKQALEDLKEIKDNILAEIDEEESRQSKEWQNELTAMNYEFEQSRL